MKIQFNTDKTVNGDKRHQDFFIDLINTELEEYESHITRVEVHVTDQNGNKEGLKDILCLMEARLEGHQPIAVSEQADTMEEAISGAIEHLTTVLDKMLDRQRHHHVENPNML